MIRTGVGLGILIIVILMIRRFCYGRVSRRLQYALWLAVPIYLALTPLLQIDVTVRSEYKIVPQSVWNVMIDESRMADTSNAENTAAQVTHSENVGKNVALQAAHSDDAQEDAVARKSTIPNWKRTVKYAGMAIVFAYFLIKNLYFAFLCRTKRRDYAVDLDTRMRIYTIEGMGGPFSFGKNIYISRRLLDDTSRLNYIVLHEYCHWRHADWIWNIVKYAIAGVFWYQPLVWVALPFVERDCELACDEAVLKRVGSDCATSYGEALLHIAAMRTFTCGEVVVSAMAGKRNMLGERIHFLTCKHKTSKIAVGVALVTVALLVVALNIGISKQVNASSTVSSAQNKAKVSISQKASGTVTAASAKQGVSSIQDASASSCAMSMEDIYSSPMKKNGDFVYCVEENALVCWNMQSKEKTVAADGAFQLGSMQGNELYYTKQEENEAVIGKLNVTDNTLQTLYRQKLQADEKIGAPYIDTQGVLYCEEETEGERQCLAYRQNEDTGSWESTTVEMPEKPDGISGTAKQCSNLVWSLEKGMVFYEDAAKDRLYLCSDGVILQEIKDYQGDFLEMQYGFMYRDTQKAIHFCRYEAPYRDNEVCPATVSENNVQYITSDEDSAYGFCETEQGDSRLVRISQYGEVEEIYTSSTPVSKLSGLSVFENEIAFFEGDYFKVIERR